MASAVHVLSVEDDADTQALVVYWLRGAGYRVTSTATAADAMRAARDDPPDVVLLDVVLPDADGIAVCTELCGLPDPPAVVFLSARVSVADRVRGLDAGAVDYLVKPFAEAELLARVRAATRTRVTISALGEQAVTDAITGLVNRRYLEYRLDELIALQSRGHRFGCLMADIDHFKKINDEHGHGFGDEVLRIVAQRLLGTMRGSDVVARFGGEEFFVLLHDVDLAGAAVAGEKLRAAVADTAIELDEPGGLTVTVSVGVAAGPFDDATAALATVDDALYDAKARGRDTVALAKGDR